MNQLMNEQSKLISLQFCNNIEKEKIYGFNTDLTKFN